MDVKTNKKRIKAMKLREEAKAMQAQAAALEAEIQEEENKELITLMRSTANVLDGGIDTLITYLHDLKKQGRTKTPKASKQTDETDEKKGSGDDVAE